MAWDFDTYVQGVLRRANLVVSPILKNPTKVITSPNSVIANSWNLARADLSSSGTPLNSIIFPSSSASPSLKSSYIRSTSKFSKSFSYRRYKKFSGGIILYW